MNKIINLNKTRNPSEALKREQGAPEPEPDWIFTQEEGSLIAKIIHKNEYLFQNILGKDKSQTEREMHFAVLYVQKQIQIGLNRNDFVFVPIYTQYFDKEGRAREGFRIDAIRTETE